MLRLCERSKIERHITKLDKIFELVKEWDKSKYFYELSLLEQRVLLLDEGNGNTAEGLLSEIAEKRSTLYREADRDFYKAYERYNELVSSLIVHIIRQHCNTINGNARNEIVQMIGKSI